MDTFWKESVSNVRPPPDELLVNIADYLIDHKIDSADAYRTARYCFNDALGCAFEALEYPECTRFLGPVVPGVSVDLGARIPGTRFDSIRSVRHSTLA